MRSITRLLIQYGYAVLFLAVFGQQTGVPVPADPFMIAMGALSGDGHFSLAFAIGLAWTAAMSGDLIWYRVGKHWGHRALRLLCQISMEPDSCVRTTRARIVRHGPKSLLAAKFVPGLSSVATPVAGMIGTPFWQFIFWDGLGAFLWVSVYLGAGFVFRRRLEALMHLLANASRSVAVILVAAAAVYLGWKLYRRRRFLRGVAATAIRPEEVLRQLETPEPPFLVDLRQPEEVVSEPIRIPSAMLRPPAELIDTYNELPDDRTIVLYCSCPNDGASGKTSFELRKLGFQNVRPLSGGLPAWLALGFPTEPVSHGSRENSSGSQLLQPFDR